MGASHQTQAPGARLALPPPEGPHDRDLLSAVGAPPEPPLYSSGTQTEMIYSPTSIFVLVFVFKCQFPRVQSDVFSLSEQIIRTVRSCDAMILAADLVLL